MDKNIVGLSIHLRRQSASLQHMTLMLSDLHLVSTSYHPHSNRIYPWFDQSPI
jgi:hypothetical protein